MTLGEASSWAMVGSAVLYLLAMMMHALEWASARGLSAQRAEDGSEDPTRIRVDGYFRMGVVLTIFGMISHAIGFVTRGLAAQRLPWGNMHEFITSALLVVVIGYLVLVWRSSLRWLGLFITLILTLGQGLAVTVFWVKVGPLVPALHSVWFVVHIVTAVISGAAFNIAGVASAVYLLKARAQAKAAATGVAPKGYLGGLDLAKVDLLAYKMTAFAFPVWTFTVIAGAIWAQYAWGRYWNWDPKETWSLVTWVVYAAYLHARATAGWKYSRAAIISLIGFVSFWFNFIGVNLLFSGLHSYAGI